jgi:hypothetical protein
MDELRQPTSPSPIALCFTRCSRDPPTSFRKTGAVTTLPGGFDVSRRERRGDQERPARNGLASVVEPRLSRRRSSCTNACRRRSRTLCLATASRSHEHRLSRWRSSCTNACRRRSRTLCLATASRSHEHRFSRWRSSSTKRAPRRARAFGSGTLCLERPRAVRQTSVLGVGDRGRTRARADGLNWRFSRAT